MGNDDVGARLDEVEAKLCLAEDLIEALNRTVFRQQERIDLLQREVQHLYRQLQEAAASGQGEPRDLRDEIPPHY